MEQDGYKLEWPELVDLSTKSFKWMALKHSFERNFIKDSWNLDKPSLALDPGWWANELWQVEGDHWFVFNLKNVLMNNFFAVA
jgi:hypothetical protein